METLDDETTLAAIDFMQRQVKAGKPFFTWMNTTRMHLFTPIRPSMQGQSGMPGNDYADGMIEHDGDVGTLLKAVDDVGIANDTIVVYTTDNGPNQFSWPDAATTRSRSEKDTNGEGAFRVPAMVRWPGHIKPGTVSNRSRPATHPDSLQVTSRAARLFHRSGRAVRLTPRASLNWFTDRKRTAGAVDRPVAGTLSVFLVARLWRFAHQVLNWMCPLKPMRLKGFHDRVRVASVFLGRL
jgi:arylsulfatase A-like enzyme